MRLHFPKNLTCDVWNCFFNNIFTGFERWVAVYQHQLSVGGNADHLAATHSLSDALPWKMTGNITFWKRKDTSKEHRDIFTYFKLIFKILIFHSQTDSVPTALHMQLSARWVHCYDDMMFFIRAISYCYQWEVEKIGLANKSTVPRGCNWEKATVKTLPKLVMILECYLDWVRMLKWCHCL